jgi:hypothetical protein
MGEREIQDRVEVDGGKGAVQLRSDGIIHLIWNPSVRIEAQDARAAMVAVNKVAGELEYPMLVDMATTESVTREVRLVFSIRCAASRIALLGLIVSLEAIFLSTFVMIGQNRQAVFQQVKADHDYTAQEQLLEENTDLTRAVHELTRQIHERILPDGTASATPDAAVAAKPTQDDPAKP